MLVSYQSTLNQSFDFIRFTKTWLDDQSVILDDFFPQHLPFRSIRSGELGGGSAVYNKRNFESSMISDRTHTIGHVEFVFVKVSLHNKISSYELFLDLLVLKKSLLYFFSESIPQFNLESTDIIIGVYKNVDLLKISISDKLAVQFCNTINYLSMVPTITRLPRVARTSCTLQDICLLVI